MKSIKLRGRKPLETLVDDDVYEWAKTWRWYARDGYAVGAQHRGDLASARLHRLILGAGVDQEVDHINGDRLDNRRQNLRLCSRAENQRNKAKPKNNTSGYKGVRQERSGRWAARIYVGDRERYLGTYDSAQQAHAAYCQAAQELHGAFAHP